MGMATVGVRDNLLKPKLNIQRCLAGREPGAIADPEQMRVDSNGRFAEGDVKHHIRRLASNAGQRFKLLARARHYAGMFRDKLLREQDDVSRLGAIKADG